MRIDQTIKNNKLLDQPNIVKTLENAKNGNGRLHFLGLVRECFYRLVVFLSML